MMMSWHTCLDIAISIFSFLSLSYLYLCIKLYHSVSFSRKGLSVTLESFLESSVVFTFRHIHCPVGFKLDRLQDPMCCACSASSCNMPLFERLTFYFSVLLCLRQGLMTQQCSLFKSGSSSLSYLSEITDVQYHTCLAFNF